MFNKIKNKNFRFDTHNLHYFEKKILQIGLGIIVI